MKIFDIKKESLTKYEIKDFGSLTKKIIGLKPIKGQLKQGVGISYRERTYVGLFPVVRIYSISGTDYYQSSNYMVYKDLGSTFTRTVGSNGPINPSLVSIYESNSKKNIFIANNKVVNAEDGTVISTIPLGGIALTHNGRLYVANSNTVSYSETFNYTSFSSSNVYSGYFKLDGNVVGMFGFNGYVLIITTNGTYKLIDKGYAEDYYLSKCPFPLFSVTENTCKMLNDKVVFLSGKDVVALDGTTYSVYENVLSKTESVISTRHACTYLNNYLLQVNDSVTNKNYAVVFDDKTKSFYRKEIGDKIVGDNGLMVDNIDGKMYCFTEETDSLLKSVEIENFDFDLPTLKRVKEIIIKCEGNGFLTLNNETHNLTSGTNRILFNCVARKFNIELNSTDENFSVKKMTVLYHDFN